MKSYTYKSSRIHIEKLYIIIH